MAAPRALFFLSAALLLGTAFAQSSSTSNCTTAIVGLAPCVGFITGNSSTAPSPTCCSQLTGVVKSEPQCLCVILGGGAAQYGLVVNQTKALQLPVACKVSTPPASECKSVLAGGPAPAPTAGTSGSSGQATPTPGLGSGSKSSSAPLDVASINLSFSLAFLLYVASYAL